MTIHKLRILNAQQRQEEREEALRHAAYQSGLSDGYDSGHVDGWAECNRSMNKDRRLMRLVGAIAVALLFVNVWLGVAWVWP